MVWHLAIEWLMVVGYQSGQKKSPSGRGQTASWVIHLLVFAQVDCLPHFKYHVARCLRIPPLVVSSYGEGISELMQAVFTEGKLLPCSPKVFPRCPRKCFWHWVSWRRKAPSLQLCWEWRIERSKERRQSGQCAGQEPFCHASSFLRSVLVAPSTSTLSGLASKDLSELTCTQRSETYLYDFPEKYNLSSQHVF